ncbi:MAG TPA: helix-turn-helix domain-containing protein [Nevskiaceae bacterium]|nr:helix-turn-helix domain-containing protein [Nevskiaceae bacterium]
MSNFASAIKAEISRLAKKETKGQVTPLRKAVTTHRREIAALKRELATLRKQLARGPRAGAGASAAAPASADEGQKLRFQVRGLISERKRLGLSQKDFGRLVGVSGQTILSWEQRKSAPRRAQVLSIAAIRGIGKREAAKRLEG